jgi:hypothetical protein
VEPRRIDLDALLNAHAFMRVERPPLLWEVDVDDEPFIRTLGEMRSSSVSSITTCSRSSR